MTTPASLAAPLDPGTGVPIPGEPDRRTRVRVGVDIGGTKIAVLVVADDDTVLSLRRFPSASADPAIAVGEVRAAIEATLAAAGRGLRDVEAVGVGVPGRVDARTGYVRFAVNLGWHDLPLRDRLEAELGVPCVVDNDVRAAAAGLRRRPDLEGVRDLAYLSVGTGISAGVVLGGRLHRGVRGMAGEIGHVVLDPDGPPCECGLRGCLEALAAGPAIARAAGEAIAAGEPTTLRPRGEPSTADVFAAAVAGDPVAAGIIRGAGRSIARAIHQLALAYDVELVVLGGGVSRAGQPFLDAVVAALDELCASSPFARDVLGGTAVRLLPADAEAGAWGAIALVGHAEEPPTTAAEPPMTPAQPPSTTPAQPQAVQPPPVAPSAVEAAAERRR